MDPELEKFRRKIILARIAAVLILVLIIAGIAVSQWYGSESGTIAKVEYRLKNDHSRSTILDCLDIAEKMIKEGHKDGAAQVALAVDKALDLESKDPLSAAKEGVELSRELQKRGSNSMAFRFAFKTLTVLHDDLLAKAPSVKPAELLDSIDALAAVMLETKQVPSSEEVKVIAELAGVSSEPIVKTGKDKIVDLALGTLSKDSAELPSDSILTCMYLKDLVLAERAQSADLEKSFKKSFDASQKSESAKTIRSANAPYLLAHLVDLAVVLQKSDPLACAKYLGLAEDILAQTDSSKLSDEQKIELADCRRKMSEAYVSLANLPKALSCAQESITIRPLQDANSGECQNQLVRTMVLAKQYKEAEPIGISTYKFFKEHSADKGMLKLKADCAAQLFDIANGLKKNSQAVSIITAEIKEQKKALPLSADNVVSLSSKLADHYLKRSYLKAAAQCVRDLNTVAKLLKGDERLKMDIMVIKYAARIKNPELASEASSDALAYVSKNKDMLIQQEWLDGFCTMLDSLEKAGATDEYNQALDVIKTGFSQQLGLATPDPILLAKIVNQLGVSGSERTADQLRSEAVDKLPDAAASVFKSRAMDFVVSGEKESAQYTAPEQAVDVYLDLAQGMNGKDNESSFKYAFEAMKIMYLLAEKNGEYRDSFLDRIQESAGLMIASKQLPNKDQLEIIDALTSMEREYIKKSGKDRLLDLTILAHAKSFSDSSEDMFSILLLKDEILAKRGQAAALDIQIAKTRKAAEKLEKVDFDLANHFAELAQLLSQSKDPAAAKRYLSMSARTLDSIPADKMPDANQRAQYWTKMAGAYQRIGETQSAMDSTRKALAARPVQDYASGNNALMLVDKLFDQGNYAEAEPLAFEVFRVAREKNPSPEMTALRAAAVRRLFRTMLQLHKEAAAVTIVKGELEARQTLPGASALQTADLNLSLATYYILNGDPTSSKQHLDLSQQAKATLQGAQKAEWERSVRQRDVITIAVHTNDPKLVAQAVSDLAARRDLDKSELLKNPTKWWKLAIEFLGKNGEADTQKQLVELVQNCLVYQMSKPGANGDAIGEIVMDLNGMGQQETASSLRDLGEKKLSGQAREAFLARCKDLPASNNSDSSKPAEDAGSGSSPAPASPVEDGSGRLDINDR